MSTDEIVTIPDTLPTQLPEATDPTTLPAESWQQLQATSPSETGESDEDLGLRSASFTEWIRGGSACFISMAFHILALVVLGLVGLDNAMKSEVQTILASPIVERPEDEPVEIELTKDIELVETTNVAMVSSAPAVAGVGTGPAATVGTPTLDQRVVSESELPTNIAIEAPTVGMPSANKLVAAVPDGDVKGEPRALVGDYQQALDRIAQELMWMLDKGPVLATWVFDESESMKDDQQEIRDRVHNVYRQLGIYGRTNSEALLTTVVSYGEDYHMHTPRPTADMDEIKKAIDGVPVDASGKEMMCQAVGKAVHDFRKHAVRGRQMALILVTDESGERPNNDQYLEAAIAEARSANCKIFVLGRESVFGYPYAYITWRHPTTRRVHWLQIDRGPETGFPEQLQTNGFHRRHDAFSSGFGPYEQSRLARETNGVFFMLPSMEPNLVGAYKRSYGTESMRPFRPDLKARVEVFADRDKFPLRALIWKVISDLNPWNPQSGRSVELTVEFSTNPQQLVEQIQNNQKKAIQLLRYLADAEKAMEQGKHLREQEADPRWQANYDLIFAQLVAYQARIYEYGAGLQPYLAKPPYAAATKSPNLVLVHWDVAGRKETLTKESEPYIERAAKLLREVSEAYPDTPWSARADWELQRGFGIHLVADYDEAIVNDPNAKPPPKL
jgi:hypothetical protein